MVEGPDLCVAEELDLAEGPELYTAEKSNLYTDEGPDLREAEGPDLYTVEGMNRVQRSDLRTAMNLKCTVEGLIYYARLKKTAS